MSFMTNDIIADILTQETNGSNFEILDTKLENGIVKPGNNYCSEASRYVINYQKNGERKTKRVFLKVPYNVRHYDLLQEKGLYKKELYMYRVVLSTYHSLLPDDPVAPLYYSSDGKDAIILEDITETGYQMCNRYKQLDFEHCAVAFKTLARYHAFSVKLHQTNPKILDEVRKESIFNTSFFSNGKNAAFYEKRFSKVAARADPEYAKIHADTFEFYKNNLVQSAIQLLVPSENDFNVLNHGDFWTNNIMFKYDSYGRVSKAKLVDFQLCRWSSPVIDIFYFTINSMKFDVYEKYFDLLLEVYVETLNAVMSYLECDQTLTIDNLRKDIEGKYNYGVLVLVGITPTVVANPNSEVGPGFDERLLDEERYIELSNKWFSHFTQKGVFSKYHDTVNAINIFLKSFQEENGTVTKYDLDENIIKAGNNFCSVISRLKLEYEKDGQKLQKSVLLKIPSLSPNYEVIGKTIIYDREIYAYKILLPKLYELWNGAIFSPVVYAMTETKVLVMEDLNEAGYTTKNKKMQLDLDHCKIALRTLAQYHALSLKFLLTSPEYYQELSAEDMGTESSLTKAFFAFFSRFIETVSGSLTESQLDKLRLHNEPSKTKMDLYFSPHDDGLNVILHGDFWLNNILFKNDDDGEVRSAKFIDWQICRKGSPAMDLIYFFVSSVQFDVYEKYHDYLFNFYLDVFNNTLLSLRCDYSYTRSELNKDIKKYKFMYVNTAVGLLQIIMSDESRLMDCFTAKKHPSPYKSIAINWLRHLDAEDLL